MIDLNGITLVVTGFPRSGTSMMMRMLQGAGIEVITDEETKAPSEIISKHKHSPYGSLELENVGNSLAGSVEQRMTEAETANKVVKVVCPYAPSIPVDRPVKAIFMQRDINEIITSLVAMKKIWDEDIAETIAWTREYLECNNISTLYVQYKEAVKYPKTTALRIQDFLEADLDIEGMVKAVDRNARTRYKTDKSLPGYGQQDKLLSMNIDDYQNPDISVYTTPIAGVEP